MGVAKVGRSRFIKLSSRTVGGAAVGSGRTNSLPGFWRRKVRGVKGRTGGKRDQDGDRHLPGDWVGLPQGVLGLDPENIGRERAGVMIEDGCGDTGAVRRWADVLLVTGSALANGTITGWLDAPSPVIFYGTTIAGAAALLGLPRFCPCSA